MTEEREPFDPDTAQRISAAIVKAIRRAKLIGGALEVCCPGVDLPTLVQTNHIFIGAAPLALVIRHLLPAGRWKRDYRLGVRASH